MCKHVVVRNFQSYLNNPIPNLNKLIKLTFTSIYFTAQRLLMVGYYKMLLF